MIEFHRGDFCIVEGKKHVMLTDAEGVLFNNLWQQRGKWVDTDNLLKGWTDRMVPSEDLVRLIQTYMSKIRKKLRDNKIGCTIESQRQSFWINRAYRVVTDGA